MESEKLIYWTTLSVLALATITGFVTEHRGWGDHLAERSLAMLSQASQVAADYAGTADMAMGRSESRLAIAPRAVLDIQTEIQPRLACLQSTLMRQQAQLARVQAMKFRVRGLKLAPRTIVLPEQNIVIEVPQTPETLDGTF